MLTDPPEHIDKRRHRIGPEPLQQGDALVVGHVCADPGIQAHGADVQAEITVAVNQVKLRFLAVQQPLQIPEGGSFTEDLHKIIAAASGVVGHRHVGEACRAADDLIEGAVTAAGVDPQFFSGLRRFCCDTSARSRCLGHLDAVGKPPFAAHFFNGCGIFLCPVPASRSRIDDEKMGHGLPP